MYAQELLVHDSGEGKGAERLHTSFIDIFRVFMLALQLEGEVIRQMPAFVVAPE